MPERRSLEDWQRLVPELGIEQKTPGREIDFDSGALSSLSAAFWKEGYIALPPLFRPADYLPVRAGMERLKRAALPPVYIYLFDEPWLMAAKLGALVRHFLGDYGILPNLWAWHLAEEGETGWPLHRDCDAVTVFGERDEWVLMSLSLWLPLTDADERNGCMYVVPLASGEGAGEEMQETPLPAKAGSVLGWRQDLLHRGGAFTARAQNPRLSLSFEFQNRAFDPLAKPLIDPRALPSFDLRQRLIQAQFAKYRHIDPARAAGK